MKRATNENNKLIAEFMGLAYCTKHQYEGWYKNSEFNHRICDFDGLRYHLEWNWLIEAYHKIQDTLGETSLIFKEFFHGIILFNSITFLYETVVMAIEWYNENKSKINLVD